MPTKTFKTQNRQMTSDFAAHIAQPIFYEKDCTYL